MALNTFDKMHSSDDPWRYKEFPLMGPVRVDRILAYHYSKVRTLDIGCSFGYSTRALSKNCEVIGMDVSSIAIHRAKEDNPGLQFCIGDINHLPFKPDSFGQVTCIDVIEYFPEKMDEILTEMSGLLKEKGLLILSTCVNKKDHYNFTKEYLIDCINNRFDIVFCYPVACIGTMAIAKYIPRLFQEVCLDCATMFMPDWIVSAYAVKKK